MRACLAPRLAAKSCHLSATRAFVAPIRSCARQAVF